MSTIFALISSPHASSVAVIRISGPKAFDCIREFGFKKKITPRFCYFHQLKIKNSDEVLDEALITFFPNPQSFTGEDVVEISVHNSPFIINQILLTLANIEDVRHAQAGEFSKRAFLNGKIDLIQAEAIPDLIASETKAQHRQAIQQLQGNLGKIYDNWRQQILEISAFIEALIDFPEDDLPASIYQNIKDKIALLTAEIQNHLNDNKIGEKIKNGINLAIIGAPNVGKSSLINLLANSEVAIVSEIAGTTRDVLEVHLDIAGIAVKIADTAGIRISNDIIEIEGIKRARNKAENADIILYLIDGSNPIINHDFISEKTIIVINKIDKKFTEDSLSLIEKDLNTSKKIVKISILEKINIEELINLIQEKIQQMLPSSKLCVITQERYRQAIKNILQQLQTFDINNQIEISAENLRICLNEFAKINGKFNIDEMLDIIFSKFCIGK
ncbi:MAG: tRNA uridine-5-carboxymethylaminomethyl(34) synthesis GTPase MnmE [Rickettsiales bacterium]